VESREKSYFKYFRLQMPYMVEKPKAKYPPCYLDEIKEDALQEILRTERFGPIHTPIDYRMAPYWHTPVTGLWHMQTRQTRIWFDGGRMDNPESFHIEGFGPYSDQHTLHAQRA